jgi:signal transduction histidine kinase
MLALAVLVGGFYALGAEFVFRYLLTPAEGATFFPSAGVTLAALLLCRRSWWPAILVAVAVAEISIDLAHHQTVFMAFGFATANVVEPAVGAALLVALLRRRRASPHAYFGLYIVCAAVIGPAIGGLVGGTVSWIAGSGHMPSSALSWWLGDGLGVLIVGTAILSWRQRDFYETSASLIETFAIAALGAVVVMVPTLWVHESFAYLAVPVMIFAALRAGTFGVGLASAAVGFSASWLVATGHAGALLNVDGPRDALLDTQIFIAVSTLVALAFAVEVLERSRVQRVLRQADANRVRAELAVLHASANERTRIARETHDIVGHALNVMLLSSAGARRVLDRDPEKAKQLLGTIEAVGRDAFDDLDVALGLADEATDLTPPKGLADLSELVARLDDAGMRVDFRTEGEVRPLSRLLEASAYRIVQESLTNVAKHAEPRCTHVTVRYEPSVLRLEVRNDGVGPVAARNGVRRGLIGMRERVAVLGGRLEAGPTGDGTYSVVAELPIPAA